MNLINHLHSSTLTKAPSASSKAPKQPSIRCLYNIYQGVHEAKTEKSLAHALNRMSTRLLGS